MSNQTRIDLNWRLMEFAQILGEIAKGNQAPPHGVGEADILDAISDVSLLHRKLKLLEVTWEAPRGLEKSIS